MPLTIEVWFDYICPFSVMVRKVLADAVTDPGTRILWHPLELHPEGTPRAGEGDHPSGVWENSVVPMARRLGVPVGPPHRLPLPRTALALRGYCYAREHGAAEEYNDRMFAAHFREQRDIGDPSVVLAVAREAGLDPDGVRARITSARDAERHRREQRDARRVHRVHTVPTVLIGRWRAEGVPTPERVRDVIAELTGPGAR
ncbi:DsbA family protein [Streptomyces sp. NPDC052309]|uniref:DsbA family protein n=1 Tax=Streptomyces griseicoloratus TaxID=2752516 RepID=A0A926L2I1_9ACTN|nr:DsbA family protein [Streptomyces griseicoloratus]MBD0420421.1 DsbA family protein [Streptomyces griseicoloratus]